MLRNNLNTPVSKNKHPFSTFRIASFGDLLNRFDFEFLCVPLAGHKHPQ